MPKIFKALSYSDTLLWEKLKILKRKGKLSSRVMNMVNVVRANPSLSVEGLLNYPMGMKICLGQ
jgi:hypothetical protein